MNPLPVRVSKWPFWVLDGILLLATAYIVFWRVESHTPQTQLIVILAITLAAFLALGPYLVELAGLWLYSRTMEARAGETIRKVLKRAEEVEGRLEQLEQAAAKPILIARQMPDRIEEQMGELKGVLRERIQSEVQELREQVRNLRKLDSEALAQVAAEMGKASKLVNPLTQAQSRQEEFMEKAHELENKLAAATAKLRGFFEQADQAHARRHTDLMEALHKFIETPMAEANGEGEGSSPMLVRALQNLDDTAKALSTGLEAWRGERDMLNARLEGIQKLVVDLSEVSPSDDPAPKKKTRETRKKATDDQPSLFGLEEDTDETNPRNNVEAPLESVKIGSIQKIEASGIEIRVEAMVGVSNRLFLRGEGGGLSWEKGIPLEVVGIGRWRWLEPSLDEPIKAQVYLNDEEVSQGDIITAEPGKVALLKPIFASLAEKTED